MSDEVETAVSVLHLLSGRYAEVHISQERMVIKFQSACAIKLFHQAFLTNFENLIERYNDLRKRHSDLICKVKKLKRENEALSNH